jgi:penicillin-binding protein 1A
MYFGVSARKLTLWQAAVIAGLPRAPSRFNPRTDPAAAAARARDVLAAMVDTGAITQQQAQAASAQINFPPRPSTSGWFADWAAEQAQQALPTDADAVIHTTIDSRLQSVAESRLNAILDGPGASARVSQGAVVIMDAATGAVRALVGGRDYRQSPYDRAVAARRQPGSSFKPFVWLNALEKGMRPDDMVLDAPIKIGNWSPADFEKEYLGQITLEEALAQSINTVSVRLLLQNGGPRAVAAVAKRLGIDEKLPDNASLALGTGEVRPIELAAAYAAIFNGGYAVTPTGIEWLQTNNTKVTPPHATPTRVIDGDLAGMMVRMMAAVVTRGTGRAAAVQGRMVAGKTGTTQDYKDAWFVGSTGGVVIAVWLGNDDNHPMHNVTGGSLPARVFHDIAVEVR